MENTINTVVNNLAERVEDLASMASPVVSKVGEISTTVVHETAVLGFYNIIIGIAIFCLGMVCLCVSVWGAKNIKNKNEREILTTCMVVLTIALIITGFSVAMCNVKDYVSPTKQVLREVITHLNE